MTNKFYKWLHNRNEAVSTDISGLNPEEAPPPMKKGGLPQKDSVGFPLLQHGGFRKKDMDMIKGGIPYVEDKLTAACSGSTRTIGVNWVCCYFPPTSDMPTVDDPEDPTISMRDTYQRGKEGWDKYEPVARKHAESRLDQFLADIPEANKDNTVVYIKPTSRVHGLSPWQQMHNKGHAIWTHARENYEHNLLQNLFFEAASVSSEIKNVAATVAEENKTSSSIQKKFIVTLRDMFDSLHRQHYDATGKKPNATEMTILLARTLPVGASFRRIFQATSGKLDNPLFKVNTALNSFQEAMFDLAAIWFHSGGRIPLKTQGSILDPARKKEIIPDRSTAIDPEHPARQEIERKYGSKVRPYVYEPLQSSDKWQEYADQLSEIVADAIEACVWNKVGGPIYATRGYLTTGA